MIHEMGRALSIVERTRKTMFSMAKFANIPESPSFSYGEYVNLCYTFKGFQKTES